MSQGEQEGSSYILIQHKNHQWIERLDGPNRLPSRYSYYDETAKVVEELNRLADRIKQLEAVVNDPEALWANWLRGTVRLPSGIGDVRQYQDRIKRLEEFARTIENDFDHDEDAHRYGTTCRVCDAEDLLKETKEKEAKP